MAAYLMTDFVVSVAKVQLTKADALLMLNQMQINRRLEIAAGNLYKEKHVRGFCHLYSGQRIGYTAGPTCASPLVVLSELTGHAHVKPELLQWKWYRRSPGAGLALVHKYSEDGGVCLTLYGDGASNQVSIGAGLALVHKYSEDGSVCLTLYGDGARPSARGIQHGQAIVVAVCRFVGENNGYGIWARVQHGRQAIPRSHSMSDPGTSYRTRAEVQEMRPTKDPITVYKEKILSANLITEPDMKKMEKVIKTIIEDATKMAKEDKEIGLEELTTDVYAKSPEAKMHGLTVWSPRDHKSLAKPKNID
ncbi:Pyruvate dehydrogenase E1 alpha subunit [Carabus blaptoides fortunei]